MRTLKKTLCLVLCLAMMAGLCVFASADFKDQDKIENTEAVELLTALKVIQGNPDGSFNPKGTLTRAEAATIITKVLGAGDITASTDKFTDVKADFWGMPFIAYCVAEGVVAGYGDGTFGPNDKLTGYQWATMLLRALGYEVSGETWQITVAKLVKELKLASGITFVGTENISRDDACQMAFNALFVGEKYEKSETMYEVVPVASAFATAWTAYISAGHETAYASKALAIAAALEAKSDAVYGTQFILDEITVKSTATKDSLSEDVFGLSKNTEATDAFMRPITVYTSSKAAYKTLRVVIADEASYTVENGITSKALYNMVGYKAAGYTWTNYVDGASTTNTAPAANVNTRFGATGNGTVMYVYVDDGAKTVTTSLINTYIGDVKKITAAKNDVDRFVTLTDGKTFTTEDFAAKDVVLYTYSKKVVSGAVAGIQSMEMATVVSGKLTKLVTGTGATYTVDGVAYKVGATGSTAYGAADVNKEVSFYVDANGFMMRDKSTAATAAADYIYVLGNGALATDGDYLTGVSKYVEVYGVNQAGEVINLDVAKIDGAEPAAPAPETTNFSTVINKLYTYEKNNQTGYYELTPAGAKNTDAIEKNAVTVNTNTILNNATKFIYIEQKPSSVAVKNVKIVTGNANISTIVANTAYVAEVNGTAKYVFVRASYAPEATATDKVVYVTGTPTVSIEYVDGKATTTYTYENAWTVDGQTTITSNTLDTANGLYYINENGTIGAPITTTSGVITKISGNVIYVGTTPLAVTDKTVEIFAGDDTELKVGQTVSYKKGTVAANLDYVVVTGDQVTYSVAIGTVTSGYTAETTSYEVIGGTGVSNTVKVTVKGDFTGKSTVTVGSAPAHTLTPAEQIANGSVTVTVTLTSVAADTTLNVTVA